MTHPLKDFKNKVKSFATQERKGIRNPFVIVTVEPSLERMVATHLSDWSKNLSEKGEVKAESVWLDRILPKTEVYEKIKNMPGELLDKGTIEDTLKNNLTRGIADYIITERDVSTRNTLLLLLHLGSLYPFGRASNILDELDRRSAKATVGVLYPGEPIAGKLSFYGASSRHYYPAHIINEQIKEVYLP